MQRWLASVLLRFLRFLLPCASLLVIPVLWTRLNWILASIGTTALAPCLPEVVHAIRIYVSSPTFRPVRVAANTKQVLQSGIRRLSYLQMSPGGLTDVLGFLTRTDADACQLVCRAFSQSINERARDIPLYEMTQLRSISCSTCLS